MDVRRVGVSIEYTGKDITRYLDEFVSKITITDNFKGTIDDLSINLRNDSNRFLQRNWALDIYEQLKVDIVTENWRTADEGKVVYPCGIYNIDSRNFSEKEVSIKALSIPLGEAQDQANSKTWENVTLEELGAEFSKKYDLEFKYLVKRKIKLFNLRQEKETDFSFLEKIAEDECVNLKISFNKLILFDSEDFEKKEPSCSIDLREISYRISERTKEVYDAVEVTYTNPLSNKTEKIIVTDTGSNKVVAAKKKKEKDLGKHFGMSSEKPKKIKLYRKILKVSTRSKSGNLEELGRKKLKRANEKRVNLSFTAIGDSALYAGSTFLLVNAGIFNGKYIVDKISKTVPGYIFSVEAYLVESNLKEEENELS